MSDHTGADERLVVDELVELGGLCLVVENQRPSERCSVLDHNLLVLSPPLKHYCRTPLGLH